VWADSFSKKKYTVSSIIYEKAAVMFNIAALYTQAAFEAYNVDIGWVPNRRQKIRTNSIMY